MARPKVPLISRRKVLETALAIVDDEGLDALSIRRLGEALNVNGASLYHHFRNKDEILDGVTQLALESVDFPLPDESNWRVWLPLTAYRTRAALVAHPGLIPVMLRRASMGIGTPEAEQCVARLQREGVSPGVIAPLIESLELLAVTSALQEVGAKAMVAPDATKSGLAAARGARGVSPGELFEVMVSSTISLVESAITLKESREALERVPAGRVRR
ncbi:TetR/AcrR family transcriptional regulator [Herbidospora mongoliensis]|uniref:TetR/AcrR family transcriptional regulator n=1 Tax=Herbidospora mongoliensis TaxID=688067 RepID=UPI000831F82D|nr:TetR/AcrR family transcriptional regulator [Herbidospora mongoliensis]